MHGSGSPAALTLRRAPRSCFEEGACIDSLGSLFLGQPVWMWLTFLAAVVVLLAPELGVLHRTAREIGLRESLLRSAG